MHIIYCIYLYICIQTVGCGRRTADSGRQADGGRWPDGGRRTADGGPRSDTEQRAADDVATDNESHTTWQVIDFSIYFTWFLQNHLTDLPLCKQIGAVSKTYYIFEVMAVTLLADPPLRKDVT